MELGQKVSLSREKRDGFLHMALENFAYFRLQRWKNNPRLNFLWVRSFLIVLAVSIYSLLAFMIFLAVIPSEWAGEAWSLTRAVQKIREIELGSLIKIWAGFLGSISIVFWNLNAIYRQQWQYCQHLYNEMLKNHASEATRQLLSNALAIDLLVVDLWAHRSFSGLFSMELNDALEARYSTESGRLSELKTRIREGRYSEDEALELLEWYQEHLFELIHPGTPESDSPSEKPKPSSRWSIKVSDKTLFSVERDE